MQREGLKKGRVLILVLLVCLCGCLERPPVALVVPQRTPAQPVEVRRGDTVYSVARRHNVAVRQVIDANKLVPPYKVEAGQQLSVPEPAQHVVVKGETLYSISRRYGTDTFTLAQANRLAPPYTLSIGQILRIATKPEANVSPSTVAAPADLEPPVVQKTAPRPEPKAKEPATAAGRESSSAEASKDSPPRPRPRSPRDFAWPLQGTVLSSFGPTPDGLHNDGINIATQKGTPVRAAASGIVAYAGNELKGFGNLILLRHAGGWATAYAHNDALLVSRGAAVKRGQVIAHAGQTGNVDRPQLHFEIRRGTQAVDPVAFLAAAGANSTQTAEN